jgi:hypothetical protein
MNSETSLYCKTFPIYSLHMHSEVTFWVLLNYCSGVLHLTNRTYKSLRSSCVQRNQIKIFTVKVTYCFRFRSAKEAEILEQRAQERGEVLPSEARFDSNCITPGTEFMARLHEQLKYFVTYKVSTDTLWHNVKVILSGHEVSITVVRHFFFYSRLCHGISLLL